LIAQTLSVIFQNWQKNAIKYIDLEIITHFNKNAQNIINNHLQTVSIGHLGRGQPDLQVKGHVAADPRARARQALAQLAHPK
jgi:hypothetical protein